MQFRNWFQLFLVIGSIVPAIAVDGVWIGTASSSVWTGLSPIFFFVRAFAAHGDHARIVLNVPILLTIALTSFAHGMHLETTSFGGAP